MHKLTLNMSTVLNMPEEPMGSDYASIYMTMSNCQDSEYTWFCVIYPNVPSYTGVLNMVESA